MAQTASVDAQALWRDWRAIVAVESAPLLGAGVFASSYNITLYFWAPSAEWRHTLQFSPADKRNPAACGAVASAADALVRETQWSDASATTQPVAPPPPPPHQPPHRPATAWAIAGATVG